MRVLHTRLCSMSILNHRQIVHIYHVIQHCKYAHSYIYIIIMHHYQYFNNNPLIACIGTTMIAPNSSVVTLA